MDLVELGFVIAGSVGSLLITFVLANTYLKEALNKAQKTQVLEQLLKQLNIKDFKVTDLNTDKLDDKGFLRLMTMLASLYAQKSSGGEFGRIAEMQQQVAQFMQSLRAMGTQPGQQPGVLP